MDSLERNDTICQLYRDGLTMQEIGDRFDLTKVRIMQILHGAHVTKPNRKNAFTGIHLSQAVKAAVKEEATREKTSVSGFISQLVVEELKRRNVVIVEIPVYTGEPLPLEPGA